MSDLNLQDDKSHKRSSERGSALVYILIAIALLAALTVTFMEPSSQQTSSQSSFRAVSTLQSQANSIGSALQRCILTSPNGDTTITTATDPGYNEPFPVNPNSTHLPAALRASNLDAGRVRCPGQIISGETNANQHELIFSGTRFIPPPPDLFEPWQYFNGSEGVFYWNRTTRSDAFLESALEKLDTRYSACESDIIDARSAAVDMNTGTGAPAGTGDGAVCNFGELCFRKWIAFNQRPGTSNQDCP